MFDAVFVPIRCQQSSCTRRTNHRYFSRLVFMFPIPAAARQSLFVTAVTTTAEARLNPALVGLGLFVLTQQQQTGSFGGRQ